MWTEPRRKVIGVPLRKEMQRAHDGSLTVRGYFTSDRRDEVGDIITRAATIQAIPRYRQWSNVRYMHLPRPVAKVTRIGDDDGLEWNEVEIKVIDPQTVFEVEQGLLTALSIGILVNFEDVDFLEDGGWVINNYTLAEISLVDHPANYDARLKELPVDQSLRNLAREHGMVALARSMQSLLERELTMDDEILDTTAAEDADLPLTETVAPDVSMPEEEVSQVNEPEDSALPIETDVSEADDGNDLADILTDLLEEVRSLTKAFSQMHKALETWALSKQLQSEETGAPVDRKGALPETVLPDEKSAGGKEAQPVTDLRQALFKYFTQRQR